MSTQMESTTPAKSLRSSYWFARIDGNLEFLTEKCKVLSTWIDIKSALGAYHVGSSKENPHCHIVMELSSTPQKQSFDKRIKSLFAIEKKSQYSTKIWDGIRDAGAASYLFHETDVQILVRKGWEDAELDTARATNAAIQKVVAVNKQRASTKLVDKAVEHFTNTAPTRGQLLRFMLLECRDGGSYYPGTFQLKKYVEEAMLKLTDNADFEYFAAELETQMWRS